MLAIPAECVGVGFRVHVGGVLRAERLDRIQQTKLFRLQVCPIPVHAPVGQSSAGRSGQRRPGVAVVEFGGHSGGL